MREILHCAKNEFSIKDFFSNCDQINQFLWFWSHLLKKSLMENSIFCAVMHSYAFIYDSVLYLILSQTM